MVHSDSSLSKFNASTGDWGIYLVMSVLTEYIVVLIYTSAGLRLPLKKDEVDYHAAHMHRMSASDVQPFTLNASRASVGANCADKSGYMPSYAE